MNLRRLASHREKIALKLRRRNPAHRFFPAGIMRETGVEWYRVLQIFRRHSARFSAQTHH